MMADDRFLKRQEALKERINQLDREVRAGNPQRDAFFEAVGRWLRSLVLLHHVPFADGTPAAAFT